MLRIIGVASGFGAPDPGCADGPRAVRDSPMSQRLAGEAAWAELVLPHGDLEPWARTADVARRVGGRMAEAFAAGEFPVVIGGDHSCAIGTWSETSRKLAPRGPLGLLWIDAHMDSHVPQTSPSHAIHGMPLAALLGQGEPAVTALAGEGPALQPAHVCLLAARSYEPAESHLLHDLGVRIISQKEVEQRGIEPALLDAVARVATGTAGFGISLDLDAIDPVEAPGVGSPAPDGLHAQPLLAALATLFDDPRLVALEIAEYNPSRDRQQVTLRLIVDLIERLAGALAARRDATRDQLQGGDK